MFKQEAMMVRSNVPLSQCVFIRDVYLGRRLVGGSPSQCPNVPMRSHVRVCRRARVRARMRVRAYLSLFIGTLGHWDRSVIG
jgi:hypothetical protein